MKIYAEPMNLDEYNKFRGWTIPENENPSHEGYLVKYPPDRYFAMEEFRAKKAREQFRHSIFGMNTD